MAEQVDTVIEEIPSEEEDKDAGVPIFKIISYPSDPTLELLADKMEQGEIIIPKFQRGWVWKHVQASRLIESFLLGLPVPAVFVFKETSEKQVVIDGQQRLRTIAGFFKGRLPDNAEFYLRGVSPQWEGKCYQDLAESERRHLRNCVLREVVVQQLDPKDNTSIYHIFERLNTGGTGLTPQEVRNCTYHGPFNELVMELNRNTTWRLIFGSDEPDTRMRDIELIVRFLALLEGSDSYTKPMKQFLSSYMAKHQWDNSKQPYEDTFAGTARRVYESLGQKPFHVKRGINVAAFDSVMIAFARSSATPNDIVQRYKKLLSTNAYLDAISSGTTDVDTVKSRIKLAQETLFK